MDNWLQKPNVVRIVAVVLGVLLWAVVNMDYNSSPQTPGQAVRQQIIQDVAVVASGLDSKVYSIRRIDPEAVTVIANGKESALNRINTRTARIEVDVSDAGVGTHLLPLTAAGFPKGVTVDISPASVSVTIEENLTKEMAVVVDVVGSPDNGYSAGPAAATPDRVHVSAPQSVMEQVDTVRAKADIGNRRESLSAEIVLVAFDKQGKELDVDIGPSVVKVDVPITSPYKTLPLRVRVTGDPSPGYSIDTYHLDINQVTVFGPLDVLDSLDYYEGPTVDLNGMKESKKAQYSLPIHKGVVQVVPNKVTVDILIVPSEVRTFHQLDIAVIGQSPDFTTHFIKPDNGKIDAVLEGAANILGAITPDSIRIIADVTNMQAGTGEVTLAVNLPPFVKLAEPIDLKATVEIREKTTPATAEPADEEEPGAEPETDIDPEPVDGNG